MVPGLIIAFGILLLMIRTKIGQKFIALFVIFVAIATVISIFRTSEQPIDAFIKEKNVTVTSKTISGGKITEFPWFANDTTNYYILYPAVYYSTPKNSTCIGFNPKVRTSWCNQADQFIPKCYFDYQSKCRGRI